MRYLILIISLFLAHSLVGQEWEFKKEVDGIKAYHQSIETSKFKRYRITSEFEGKLEGMVAILQDIDIYTEIFGDLGEAILVEESGETHFELLSRTKTPFPVKDRFSYTDTNYSYDPTTKTVRVALQCKDNEYLQGYAKKGILVKDCSGSWEITNIGDGKLAVTHEFFADPEGVVPAWIINQRTIDSPIKTFKTIKKIINKDKYRNSTFEFITY